MSAQNMLEQLLKSGLSMLDNKQNGNSQSSNPGSHSSSAGTKPSWDTFGKGAAAGGVLGLLLGSKRGRSMGGTVLKYGSLAALGTVAYKAYQNYQTQQALQNTPAQTPAQTPAISTNTSNHASGAASSHANKVDAVMPLLSSADAEVHSQAVLIAMIGAAKSDGHLDERERGLIDAELVRQNADEQERRWMEEELSRPLDPAEIARAASTPELGAEMYLASLLVADETSFMERAYLDELARQLKLAPELKAALEAQARSA